MGGAFEKFWWGTTTGMRIAFLGFIVAAVGVILGFSIDYGPSNPVSYVAYGVVAAGVCIGFSGVVFGIVELFKGRPRGKQ